MDNVKKISPAGESWSEYRKRHYTAEEIAENDLMVKLVGEIIKTRKEKHISQRELEDMTGVKQSVIARMESGKTDPQLSTILKLLVSKEASIILISMILRTACKMNVKYMQVHKRTIKAVRFT